MEFFTYVVVVPLALIAAGVAVMTPICYITKKNADKNVLVLP